MYARTVLHGWRWWEIHSGELDSTWFSRARNENGLGRLLIRRQTTAALNSPKVKRAINRSVFLKNREISCPGLFSLFLLLSAVFIFVERRFFTSSSSSSSSSSRRRNGRSVGRGERKRKREREKEKGLLLPSSRSLLVLPPPLLFRIPFRPPSVLHPRILRERERARERSSAASTREEEGGRRLTAAAGGRLRRFRSR